MNKVKVVKKDNYHRVVATKTILKGEVILILQGVLSAIPNKYSLQVGEKEHLISFSEKPQYESSTFRFLNHSCSPNSFFDIHNMALVALNDIGVNEEVVFHYCTTEYEMTSPFKCLCRSKNCLLEIRGFRYLSREKKKELASQLAPHLKNLEPTDL
ncbi:MAG: SET domain-containing protein-lysine N-methyltransferase [Bacteroidia bacterium]